MGQADRFEMGRYPLRIGCIAMPAADRIAKGQSHAGGDRFPVDKPVRKAGLSL